MDRPELKLVTADPPLRRSPWAAACGAAILAAAGIATFAGADRARVPVDAAALAETALGATLARRDASPARQALGVLRAALARNPLDAATRTVAASLMIESAEDDDARRRAAAEALAAVRLVATDEWISRGAARVLARCGEPVLALREVASIFAYAPDYAAMALADIEPFVRSEQLGDGIPATPEAWLAWSVRLRQSGREAEADARLASLRARWPDDLPALRAAAGLAASRDQVDELVRLVPPTLTLPDTHDAASLHAFRARSKAASGDPLGARGDARRAVELSGGDPSIEAIAGDSIADIDPPRAREYWNRALYRLTGSPASRDSARWIRSRLARLDEREGRAGDALRGWRDILAEHPDDAEARQRIAALTGQ